MRIVPLAHEVWPAASPAAVRGRRRPEVVLVPVLAKAGVELVEHDAGRQSRRPRGARGGRRPGARAGRAAGWRGGRLGRARAARGVSRGWRVRGPCRSCPARTCGRSTASWSPGPRAGAAWPRPCSQRPSTTPRPRREARGGLSGRDRRRADPLGLGLHRDRVDVRGVGVRGRRRVDIEGVVRGAAGRDAPGGLTACVRIRSSASIPEAANAAAGPRAGRRSPSICDRSAISPPRIASPMSRTTRARTTMRSAADPGRPRSRRASSVRREERSLDAVGRGATYSACSRFRPATRRRRALIDLPVSRMRSPPRTGSLTRSRVRTTSRRCRRSSWDGP